MGTQEIQFASLVEVVGGNTASDFSLISGICLSTPEFAFYIVETTCNRKKEGQYEC